MTKNEFINIFQSDYIFDDEDYDNQIEIVGSKKGKNVSNFFEDKIVIDLETDFCNIYWVFTYEDYDNLLYVREITQEKLLLLQALGKLYEKSPGLDFYDGMGCPFVDEYVGYFGVEYNQETIKNILTAFESACVLYQEINIDETYLMENFKTEYEAYLEYEEDVNYIKRINEFLDMANIEGRYSLEYEVG